MAYQRSITARAKQLYEQYRVAPSFSTHIHRGDNHENLPHDRPISNNSKIPNYYQRRLFGTGKNLGTFHGSRNFFNDRRFSIPSACGPAFVRNISSEVAAAAADSFPTVAALQYLIDHVHIISGFNWATSIVLTTILIRLVQLPLMINQIKSTSKFTLMRPRLEEIKEDMHNGYMSPAAVAEGQARTKELFKEYGVTPFTLLKGLLISGPIFCSFFFAVKNMAEKVPSFQEGGAFWFTDLTTPDTMLILPVLTALSFWITVECNAQEGMEGNPVAGTMKNVFRAFAVLTIPLTVTFPKAIFCYWITSNLFSLTYGLALKRPEVKKLLGIPIIPVSPPPPPSPMDQKPVFSFFETLKTYSAAQQHQLLSSPSLSSPSEVSPKPGTNQRISSSSVLNQRKKGEKGRR